MTDDETPIGTAEAARLLGICTRMARNRKTAKDAGTRFESLVAAYLAAHVDDGIERRRLSGRDRGDISGFRHMGARLVVECKNVSRLSLATWITEAEVERGNDDATAALVIHKRHGHGDPADQYVTLTLGDLVALLNGNRCHIERNEP